MSRAYHLMLAFLILNLVIFMMAQTEVFPTSDLSLAQSFATQSELEGQVNSIQGDLSSEVEGNIVSDAFASVRFFISSVSIMLSFIIKLPLALPILLNELGVPLMITGMLGTIIMFVYIIAAVQFLSNRGMKDDE